jgi:outer membrane lipoprotein-sorting protein
MSAQMRKLVILFLLTLLLATASCKRSDDSGNQNSVAANANGAAQETLTTPPFATKEPERYQALRIITSSVGGETNGQVSSIDAPGNQTFIARDGDRRRADYETTAGTKISLLQLPGGTYVLLPEKKLYAEWNPDAGGAGGDGHKESSAPAISPDKLLNEARPEAHYEKLGAETVNGRATMKYRVTLKGKMGAAKETAMESLIWVDESLGMPIKSEMTSAGGARFTMELRDIRETVDAGALDLPQDYKKVEAREIFAQSKQAGSAMKGRE